MTVYNSDVIKAAVAVQRQSIALIKSRLRTRHDVAVIQRGTRLVGCPTIARRRKTVKDIHREMGDYYFRRAFRMSILTFTVQVAVS